MQQRTIGKSMTQECPTGKVYGNLALSPKISPQEVIRVDVEEDHRMEAHSGKNALAIILAVWPLVVAPEGRK